MYIIYSKDLSILQKVFSSLISNFVSRTYYTYTYKYKCLDVCIEQNVQSTKQDYWY